MSANFYKILTILVLFSSAAIADENAKGMKLFNEKAMCATCHTMKAAGSKGNVGPNLDTLKPTVAQVKDIVTHGLGAMPALARMDC